MIVTGAESYTTTYNYDLRNRLTFDSKESDASITQNTYRYDNNGNQISDETDYYASQSSSSEPHAGFREDVAAITKREYNEFNQLVSAYIDGQYVQYTYRPDGLRHSKTVSGVTTYYIWDGSNIIAEHNQSNQVTARYIRGINLIFSEDGSGGNRKYYLYNAHGDVVQLADATGNIVWQYDYDAFGNEKSIAGQDPANDSNPFRYCGEYFDVETKTVYLRNRSYSPGTGRFTNEDPIRDGLNWYTYCGGNPIIFVDPLGLSWKSAAISSKDGFVVYFTSQWDAITHPIQTLKTVWQEANSPKSYEEIFYMSLGPTFGSDARYIKVGVEAVISGDFDQFAYATGQKGVMIAEMIAIAGVSKGIGKVGDKIKAAKGAGSKVKTNLGNEIDITPSTNHSTTTTNPGLKGTPNSSVDILNKNGDIATRRWFGSDGTQIRDVDFSNHGNPKLHPEWPHEHGGR